MRTLLLIFTITVASAIGGGIYAATKRAEVVRTVRDSTVVIVAKLDDARGSQGSGTVVGRYAGYSFVLTCHHVIEDSVKIQVHRTHSSASQPASIEVDDPDHDLALLVVGDLGDIVPTPLAAHNPELYDVVYLVGAPNGEEGTASEAMLTELDYPYNGNNYWRVSNGIMIPGISGGTATNAQGELIGVPARASKTTSQQGLIIPLNYLRTVVAGYATK